MGGRRGAPPWLVLGMVLVVGACAGLLVRLLRAYGVLP